MKEREEQVSIVQGRVLPEGVQRVVSRGGRIGVLSAGCRW
jgi:hypothetical protein